VPRAATSATSPPAAGRARSGASSATRCFDQPPPQGAFFGRVGSAFDALFGGPTRPGLRVLCVNPAAPRGGSGALRPYFRSETAGLPPGAPAIATPWVTFPGRYTARCRTAGDTTWLHVQAAADDPRPGVAAVLGPMWGLHLADVSLALGNLVDLVGRQAAAYARRGR
jgi:hypothetical protein